MVSERVMNLSGQLQSDEHTYFRGRLQSDEGTYLRCRLQSDDDIPSWSVTE